MDLKPAKGLKVRVNAKREAIFGEESVSVKQVKLPDAKRSSGVMTGASLAGYCEVEMPTLDGLKHWYPVDSLTGEHDEKIVEEEIPVEEVEDEGEGSEE